MKKFVALLLALVLLVNISAFAENTGYEFYTHPRLNFVFAHPADWAVASESEKGSVLTGYDGKLIVAVEATNVGLLLSEEEFIVTYCPMLADTYAQQYSTLNVLEAGSLVSVGERNYVKQTFTLEMEGVPVTMNMYYKLYGTYMYIIGFTAWNTLLEDAAVAKLIEEESLQVLSAFVCDGEQAPGIEEDPLKTAEENAPVRPDDYDMLEGIAMEYLTYTNSDGGYSFAYPAEMLLMSKENVQELLNQMTDPSYSMDGMNAEAIRQNADQVRQMDMAMVMYDSGVFNYNVVYQNTGINLNNELVLSALCPQFTSQYKTIYPELTMEDEGSLYTAGDKEYVTQSLQVTANGIPMTMVILYAVNGTYLYNVTFTVADFAMEDEDFVGFLNETVDLFAYSFETFAPAAE